MEKLREPRVIQVAQLSEDNARNSPHGWDESENDELYYLRVLCKLRTFLNYDTGLLLEGDRSPFEWDTSLADLGSGDGLGARSGHQYVNLHHPQLENSDVYFDPKIDFLWLGDEAEIESVEELRDEYGAQLNCVRMVIVEEVGLWDDLGKALAVMMPFQGIRVVHVWLESHRFTLGESLTTHGDYLRQAKEFQARDQPALSGKDWLVEYIDHDGNIYGRFSTTA